MAKETSLSSFLRTSLNSAMGEGVAYTMDGATPSTVKGYISTGSTLLDIAISNRKDGGIPTGRLTEITGVESIGKSLLAYHLLANVQKKGGTAVLIDTENASAIDVMRRVGIDLKELVYVQLGTTEEVFQAMEKIVKDIRSKGGKRDKDVLIVWDSVAGTSTSAEIQGEYGSHTIGLQARLISQGLRKIIPFIGKHNITLLFVNQLRTKIGVMFGDPMTTPGGKAIPYFASVRVRLYKEGDIKDPKTKDIQGASVRARVNKCKIAPPLRQAVFNLKFGHGIKDYESWIDPLIAHGVIKQGGAWYTYENRKFRRAEFGAVVESDPSLEAKFKELLYDALIIRMDEEGQEFIEEVEVKDE
tara:strand:- start:229 stop:1302 length:1074 start_codon:yes stop_codon:yes gene_type:complete